MIRVGRRIYNGSKFTDPTYPNFIPILCLTKSSVYGSLGPYVLKDDDGCIMENIWQFSKLYRNIPESIQKYSAYDKTIIWSHPAETHVDEKDQPNALYWKWREKGMHNPHAVRYPVGYHHRHACIGSLVKNVDDRYVLLDYVNARKQIYLPVYVTLVKKQPQYKELRELLRQGKNLLIIEVDGPHQESLEYYRDKYNVANDFIENSTILATKENLDIMLNDTKHAFGHGYCLAIALQQTLDED
jgi:hypothetical protein